MDWGKRLEKPDSQIISIISIFVITLLAKIMILHWIMGVRQYFIHAALMNFVTLTALYLLFLFLFPGRYLKAFWWVHLVVTGLIFVNTVYFSHFFTLVPVGSVFQVGQLGGVSESIFALMRPLYFLYFADTICLRIWVNKKKRKENSLSLYEEKPRRNGIYALAFISLSVALVGATQLIAFSTEGNLRPANLGMINYHIYDAFRITRPAPIVDPDQAEEAVQAIETEEADRRYEGLLEGRNIIVILAESLQTFPMEHQLGGQDITPVLNDLTNQETLYFSNFYEQVGWGNTSDSEFVIHNGFYPSTTTFSYQAYEGNDFYTLPMHLKKHGYSTMAFHGNDPDFWSRKSAYPGQGIDQFYSSDEFDMNEVIGLGLSDYELYKQSIPWLKETPEPFYAFYITLTCHHPFILPEQYQWLDLPAEYDDTYLGHYLQSVHYMDQQIGYFLNLLKEEGLYDDSAIIIYGDHQGVDMRNVEIEEQVSRFIGKPYEEDEMFRVPLMIHVPGSDIGEEITLAGGQIDFFPTIANLIGDPLDPGAVLGQDLLNIKEGFVAKQVHVSAGSFIDNENIFIMSPEGLYDNSRAWNYKTGEPVSLEETRKGYERALAEITLSEYVMENNLIGRVQEHGLGGILDNIRFLLELGK